MKSLIVLQLCEMVNTTILNRRYQKCDICFFHRANSFEICNILYNSLNVVTVYI